MNQNFVYAFLMCAIAGFATAIGSAIALFLGERAKRPKFAAFCTGFAAGVMIFVSFAEMFPNAKAAFSSQPAVAALNATTSLFIGMMIIPLLTLIPMPKARKKVNNGSALKKTAYLSAIAIAIHNLPEGIATLSSALYSPNLGLSVVFAIALHNIPEGIAVYMPIYLATGSRKKAFMLSALSGMTEPLGAAIGYFVLMPFWNNTINAAILAAVAGIMIYISIKELIPLSIDCHKRFSFYGVFIGMAVMGFGLLLFLL